MSQGFFIACERFIQLALIGVNTTQADVGFDQVRFQADSPLVVLRGIVHPTKILASISEVAIGAGIARV